MVVGGTYTSIYGQQLDSWETRSGTPQLVGGFCFVDHHQLKNESVLICRKAMPTSAVRPKPTTGRPSTTTGLGTKKVNRQGSVLAGCSAENLGQHRSYSKSTSHLYNYSWWSLISKHLSIIPGNLITQAGHPFQNSGIINSR